ncbi:MAG: hypothetical protein ABI718_12990 [Acidobacteriota bacterium]
MQADDSISLTVLIAGVVGEGLGPLSEIVAVQSVDLAIPPDAPLAEHGRVINGTFDSALADWILVVREGEEIDASLAEEIKGIVTGFPRAWGYRVATNIFYRGRPLVLGRNRGEVRLFHRRHARFDARERDREIKVQGPVVVMKRSLAVRGYASAREQHQVLRTSAVPQSLLRRLLIFSHDAVATGAWWRSPNTLRFLWVRAAYDASSP